MNKNFNWYKKHYKKSYSLVEEHYLFLVSLTNNGQFVGIVNEWIIDNFFQLAEMETVAKNFFKSDRNLKRVFNQKDLYEIMSRAARKNNFKFELDNIVKYLNDYQINYDYKFSYMQLDFCSVVSYFIVLDEIAEICILEKKRLDTIETASDIINELRNLSMESQKSDVQKIFEEAGSVIYEPVFIEYINSKLKEVDGLSNAIFKVYNDMLEEQNIDMNVELENVYRSNSERCVFISNLFFSISKLGKIQPYKLYDTVNAAEKVLLMDEYYEKMTLDSKGIYRQRLIKIAKKNKISEYECAKQLIKKALFEKKHIGEFLLRKRNLKLRTFFYLFVIITATIGLSILLSRMFFGNLLLGFLLLIIPSSEIAYQLYNRILTRAHKPQPLPMLDFSISEVDKEFATMIIITTIIKDGRKVKKMFETLESYYLVNRSENLYLTLLGDACSCETEIASFDEEVVKTGLECCEAINKKYGKNIFNFIYRKRKYSDSEEMFLGYERKRGAIEQFNRLLRGKLSAQQKQDYFMAQTFDDFQEKIKYVIALDADTKLVLATAYKLIGAMAHPLNRPILNAKRTRVISGYGMMQPKIDVDIESANKSIFAQIYAGLGGFDVYNTVVPDLNQDMFKEGSFIGKGIYDLEVFDELLSEKLPENLILSHDLLEGSYLRCGYLSDVELVDDFPTTYLADSTRRHRWARGDMQIISWVFKKNPLSALHRWKIFNNIRMALVDFCTLMLLFISFCVGKKEACYATLLTLAIVILPITFYVIDKLRAQKKQHTKVKKYLDIVYGIRALIIRTICQVSALPYNAKLYLDAFFRAIYRMTISKKKLLNWMTAEEAEKTISNGFPSYFKKFEVNYFSSIALIVLVGIFAKENLLSAIFLAVLFLLSPALFYLISLPINYKNDKLSEKENNDIRKLAFDTWRFFENLLTAGNNYLIPDNFQINRQEQVDSKTSSTNIGFSIVAVISASELCFLTPERAAILLENIVDTIERLPKWHGHLYNWYDIHTMKVLEPQFVSSVDSGNLVAALITLNQFLKEKKQFELADRVKLLIDATDFSKLYNKAEDVFSVGYTVSGNLMSPYGYNRFASESRLTGFIAIAKGDVSPKHWFCLDKTLTMYNGYKGLISWTGSLFEYYMPLIFMRDYPNTLIDESYHFSVYCQREYMKEIDPKLPWGISEGAYYELDDGKNFKYKEFGIPHLRLKGRDDERLVITSYSSMITLPKFPKLVYENLKRLRELGMQGEYGLYESYDNKEKRPVPIYFAHHQGMILASIANYLNNNLIQDYFGRDVRVNSFNILNKEKTQIEPIINFEIAGYKKFVYNKESFVNDIRSYNQLHERPENCILSNSRMISLLSDRGTGFIRYKRTYLNRLRKITEQDYGMFLYIKSLYSGKVISNTYAPVNEQPESYEVVFALDNAKFIRKDGNLKTETDIIVTDFDNTEIRRVTFTNLSQNDKILELTTYSEVSLSTPEDDFGHRVFNNMFVKSEYDADNEALIMKRQPRNNKESVYMAHKLQIVAPLEQFTYDTEREHFLERNDTYSKPSGLYKSLSNYTGDNLDPIVCMRNQVKVPGYGQTTVYLINVFAKSEAQIQEILQKYSTESQINDAFALAAVMSNKLVKKLNVSSTDISLYNKGLNYLIQTSKINIGPDKKKYLSTNELSQRNLWKFGISGDTEIVLIEMHDITSLGLVKNILKMYEYYKCQCAFVDVVIINDNDEKNAKILREVINEELYRINTTNKFSNTPGKVYLIESSDITAEELNLMRAIAGLQFDSNRENSLKLFIERLEETNINPMVSLKPILKSNSISYKTDSLEYFNGFGGFNADGSEYVIVNPDTPKPWSNIIANDNLGSVITNNGNGFTYFKNSREFKLTTWTNDVLADDKSETASINGNEIGWHKAVHGIGYSELEFKGDKFDIKATYFVPPDDNVKVGIYEFTNVSGDNFEADIRYWINPVLGTSEEQTTRYIVYDFNETENVFLLKNKYCMDYQGFAAYLTSSEKIETVEEGVARKIIGMKKHLNKGETIVISFVLGCEENDDLVSQTAEKYQSLDFAKKQLEVTKKYWKKRIGKIQVKTGCKSFDFMMNNWYLYQTLMARIISRTGFYQVSGAFGFRDQLQDSMNIVDLEPEIAKHQLLRCAKHQFEEGDVLHWWHEDKMFGLRSRFKDDYIWLIYAAYEYISHTADFSVLDEKVGFVQGQQLGDGEEERGIEYYYIRENDVSLYDHLELVINKAMHELGKSGIPLMGGGDWNDGMNHIGIGGDGTSVWLGFFMYEAFGKFIKICSWAKKERETKSLEDFMKALAYSLQKHAWDEDYFIRAFYDDGSKVGAKECDECKIDLISQSFSVLSGIADEVQKKSIFAAIDEQLLDRDNGIVKLLTPPFTGVEKDPGYIKNYPKGIRENGGQYTHACAWYVMALLADGQFDKAFEIYQMINPVNHSLNEQSAEKYAVEPYVIAADIYSNEYFAGQGGWTWYTGSSGWFYRVGLQNILGFTKSGEILSFSPKLPEHIKEFELNYMFGESLYHINVVASNRNKISVDGRHRKLLNLVNDGKEHNVVWEYIS